MEKEQNTEKQEQIINKRKEKIITWLKDYNNLALIGILVFAFVINLYYFVITKNQPLWWDEAEYMSTAKHWAFNIPYNINPQRPPLFSLIAAVFFKIGLNELAIKFLLEIIPSLLVVFFTYILIKEMYDKKTALISAFITSVSWIHIFYSQRMMTDSLSLLFGLLAFLCFWKGWIKKQGNNYIWLIGFFVALSFLSRLTGILYGAAIVIFLLITLQFEALKSKQMWLIPLVFLLTISPYLLWSHSYYGNALAFRSGYGGITYNTLGWQMLNYVYDFPELIFFICFLVGLLVISPLFLVLDRVILKKEKDYYPDFFMISIIVFILAFFIYFLRQGENRWLILMSIGIFAISARGIIWVHKIFSRSIKKELALILLILILVSGAYFQLKHADFIIRAKVESYMPVKEAGIWLKETSNPGDKLLSISYTQSTYYSELNVSSYSLIKNETSFTEYLELNKPRFLQVSIFEPHPDWINSWLSSNQNKTVPIRVYFVDPKKTQSGLVVYELKH